MTNHLTPANFKISRGDYENYPYFFVKLNILNTVNLFIIIFISFTITVRLNYLIYKIISFIIKNTYFCYILWTFLEKKKKKNRGGLSML